MLPDIKNSKGGVKLEDILSIINKWLPAFSAVLSVVASCYVAKIKSKNEIKKIFMSFSREDLTELKQTFSNLLRSIDNFLDFPSGQRKKELRQAISNMIAIAPDKASDILSNLNLENEDGQYTNRKIDC